LNREQVIIIGAGPCGLSAAIELQRLGFQPLIIEKASIVHSIYQYPTYLQFFSTPELLEIGGYPFNTPNDKPYRNEALHYYRNVAERSDLRIRMYEKVTEITRSQDEFELHTEDRAGRKLTYQTRYVVVATGYFDSPNILNIPGEELDKVSHFYREAHPYTGMKVAIIGGNNSAVDAALELMRVGAEVTVLYRGLDYSPNIKPWVKPIFESMVQKGRIRMLFGAHVLRIDETGIEYMQGDHQERLDNDFVLALTGFRPDKSLLTKLGVAYQEDGDKPAYNPETMETSVRGLYLAGVIASGRDANEIFIETGRHHGKLIANHLLQL
jgi:thioredoxin reductase (NADPH)